MRPRSRQGQGDDLARLDRTRAGGGQRHHQSEELLQELLRQSERGAVQVTLLVPMTGGQTRADAEQRLEAALEPMRDAGMKATGRVIRGEPAGAVMDVWRPGEFDEIVVSTLPTGASKWLQVDLPHRLERLTNALVTHVVAEPPRPRGAGEEWKPPPEARAAARAGATRLAPRAGLEARR